MSEKKDYFDYVKNVLGVESIFLDLETSMQTSHSPLLVVIEDFSNYSTDEKDLLGKMISALKIDIKLIQAIDSSRAQKYTSDFSIYFKDEVNVTSENTNSVTTYSPRVLSQKPDLKKTAWNDLQKVIAFFQNSARP